MNKVVFTLTGVRNVTDMVQHVGRIVPMADVVIYVPNKCSVSLRAALSAKVQLNMLLPRLNLTVSQDVSDVENADLIIITGFVAASKTIDKFVPFAETTMRKCFGKLNLKEGVNFIINGGVRGLVCAYFLGQIVSRESITVFEPFYFSGTKTFGSMAGSAFVYPTILDFEIYNSTSDNTSETDRSKLNELKKFPLALDTIEANVLGQTVQAFASGNFDMMPMRGKFPDNAEKDFFDVGEEFPVFIPTDGVVENNIIEMLKDPVKSLWQELRGVILKHLTTEK